MEINLRQICAINKCAASKEATRYYLNGVYVHTVGDWIHFVATDGHKLVVHRVPNVDNVEWSFIIPRQMLDGINGIKFSKHNGDIADLSFSDGLIKISRGNEVIQNSPIDGTFPDYSRVGPVKDAVIKPAVFNWKYCADLDVMAKAFDSRSIISMFGEDPAIVRFVERDDIYGVLMPVRHNNEFTRYKPF